MKHTEKKVVIPSEEEVAKYAGDGATGQKAAESAPPAAEQESESSMAAGTAQPQSAENEWKDLALRARAELSNYQKRAEKDRADSIRYANAGLVKALLPVLDNLERVVQTGTEGSGSPQALVDGAKLTLDLFNKVLREYNVEPIASGGQPFDPQVHEAMMERPSDHAERTVLQEVAKGYKLHDRVLRPARVIVSKPMPSTEAAESGNEKE